MPEPGNQPKWPDWTKEDPPDWIRDDVVKFLRLAVADRLYTRGGDGTGTWGWYLDPGDQATPAAGDESGVVWLLEEHRCIVPSQMHVLKDESGELFNAQLMEITPAGRDLLARLDSKR
ncbi:hypothetical protein [Saccharothrix sp. HUAS TT1]|uniref:hypothetical protein n=1 Tax=unclassified Saccharothrix TaxID=2593673 RepID=UPI00345B8EA2